MKNVEHGKPVKAAYLAVLLFSELSMAPMPSLAGSSLASSISCMSSDGIPVTVVTTKTQKQVPIIFWKSTVFSGSGWTPERRCREVSARFQEYHQAGKLEFITTGRINGLPVLCVTSTDGGACEGLLYTLKPGQNATATLKKLFDIQRTPGAAPLEETTARIYVSVDSVIQRRTSGALEPSATTPEAIPSQPGYSLF